MASDSQRATSPTWILWIGWGITVLVSLALLGSGIMKFAQPDGMEKEFKDHLGWDISQALALGIVELSCMAIYLFPRTSILGAILLTGYFGGAIATHVRVHDPFIPPLVLGALAWLGIYLRCGRLRAIVPWRS